MNAGTKVLPGIVAAMVMSLPGLCQIGWAEEPKKTFTLNDLQSAYGDIDRKKVRDTGRLVKTAGLNPNGFTMEEFTQAAQSAGWMTKRSRQAAAGVGEFLPKHAQLHTVLEGGFTDQQHTQFHQQLDTGHVRLHLFAPSIPDADHQTWHQQSDRLHGSFHQLARSFSEQEHTGLHQLLSSSITRTLTGAQHTQFHQLLDTRRQFLTQDLGNIHDTLHGFVLWDTIDHEPFHGFLDGLKQQKLKDIESTHEQLRH